MPPNLPNSNFLGALIGGDIFHWKTLYKDPYKFESSIRFRLNRGTVYFYDFEFYDIAKSGQKSAAAAKLIDNDGTFRQPFLGQLYAAAAFWSLSEQLIHEG